METLEDAWVDDDMALGLITCYKVSGETEGGEETEEGKAKEHLLRSWKCYKVSGETEGGEETERERSGTHLLLSSEDSKVIYLEGLTTCYMIYMWHTYKSCEASYHPMRLIISR